MKTFLLERRYKRRVYYSQKYTDILKLVLNIHHFLSGGDLKGVEYRITIIKGKKEKYKS